MVRKMLILFSFFYSDFHLSEPYALGAGGI